MAKEKRLRIVIYEDNLHRAESLKEIIVFDDRLELAGIFSNCANVVADMEATRPDVVLMDIRMPGVDGIRGTQLIKQYFPHVHVLIQTVVEEDEAVFEALKMGASGYILKKAGMEKILEAIFDVYQGGTPLTPIIATRILKYFQATKKQNVLKEHDLTDREVELLQLLASGKSYKMVAERMNISVHTVNSHTRKIYRKLHVHSATEALSKLDYFKDKDTN